MSELPSYANVTFRHEDAEAVARVIADMHRYVVISPVDKGCVVAFDRESDVNGELIVDFARILSEKIQCVAMAVMNHQDGVLLYWLFDSGKELDSYISRPDFFGGDPMPRGGDAIALAHAWQQYDTVEQIGNILHADEHQQPSKRYPSETLRHGDLADTLGISTWGVGFGYTLLAEDKFPEGFPADDTFYTEPN